MDNKEIEKIQQIAQRIMHLSRNIILVKMRFLDMAIGQLSYQSYAGSFAIDGSKIYYDPIHAINLYHNDKNIINRNIMHMMLHYIFCHPFVGLTINKRLWNLACDITVENIINELNLSCLSSPKEKQEEDILNKIKNKTGKMFAEKIYVLLMESNYPEKKIMEFEDIFCVDDHCIWYEREKQNKSSNSKSDNEGQESQQKSNKSKSDNKERKNQGNGSNSESDNESKENQKKSNNSKSNNNIEKKWREISNSINIDLSTFSKERGEQPGSLIQNLAEVNREKYDYASFLKKFSVLGETMKINDEEFDYVFYSYGMSIYKKMPLIEPLEYKEVKKIKEFVIAIDTSGSVEGELVQSFLQKTYNILEQQENFFTKFNLHIIQCDAEIQEDYKIHNRDDFDNYISNMQIKGFGGTDFRPVFEYVDDLIMKNEFSNLKGLIYFTDGFGVFPSRQPNYRTAFVFVNEDDNVPEIPAWAIKLVLKPEEIEKI